MVLENILLAVLWACIITMFITLHRLGRLLDNMSMHIKLAKSDVKELQDMIQQKIDEENEIEETK